MKTIKPKNGFTLIELIVMIAVGGFLVSGMVLFTRQQLIDSFTMGDYLKASNLAKLKMAEMNNVDYGTLNTWVPAAEPGFPGFTFQKNVTVRSVNGSQELSQVELSVYDRKGGLLARLVTFRQSHTTFGNGL